MARHRDVVDWSRALFGEVICSHLLVLNTLPAVRSNDDFVFLCVLFAGVVAILCSGVEAITLFFLLSSSEHGISTAHKN